MTELDVLSLYDGCSMGRVALERAGIPIKEYYASEIDKYAITIAKKNFPNTIHLGDVTTVRGEDLEPIDLLIGGSPCQGFSFAGKQLNFDDPRSKLFFEFVKLKNLLKPKYFLLENVRMKKQYQDIISEHLGVEPIAINSNLVSAQNRYRLYWTNIPNVTQPDDKGILLQDILEDGIASDKMTKDGKSYCLTASYQGAVWWNSIQRKQRTMVKVDKPISKNGLQQVGIADLNGHDSIKRVYHPQGKAPTLTTMGGGHREPKVLCGAWRGRYTIDGVRQDHKQKVAGLTKQRLEVRTDGKTNSLTTVQKDNVAVDIKDLHWRKLTPLECERLQTLPDWYTNQGVSNTQRYKMLGNGFTVDVIAHILKGIKDEYIQSR